MKKFMGFFLVTFMITTSANSAANQGNVGITVVRGESSSKVKALLPAVYRIIPGDISFKAADQTSAADESVDFEGVVFHSLKEYVDFSTNYVSKILPAKEIFFAIDNDDLTFLERVISNDEDVNTRDGAGNTPLHFAQSIDCVEVLVKNGADANVTNLIGNTPLHYAVYRNSLPIVKYLVEQGNAFVWIMNENGQTPYDTALINSRHDIAEYLAPFYEVGSSKSTAKKSKSKSKKHFRRADKKREKTNIDDLVESTAKLSL
ncbi:ankyrin repeat domain-containing protein [bacterium]|nr:MAG: ankyrin repeat domain-containing protein [bacterium]